MISIQHIFPVDHTGIQIIMLVGLLYTTCSSLLHLQKAWGNFQHSIHYSSVIVAYTDADFTYECRGTYLQTQTMKEYRENDKS